jgi:3-oxoacyl-[acyl-carrier protein] reductase
VADLLVERADGTAAALVSGGEEASQYRSTRGSRARIDAIIARAVNTFGRIDILVNNAGIGRGAKFLDTSPEQWDDHIRINLGGVFNCSQAAARVMAEAHYGRIVSIASVAGLMGPIDLSAYGASKAGVIGLTRAMALELAEYGIAADAIAPGPIDTELLREAWSADAYAELASHPPGPSREGERDRSCDRDACIARGGLSGVVLPVDGGSVAGAAYRMKTVAPHSDAPERACP